MAEKIFSNSAGTTNSFFTIGKKGLTLFPSINNPAEQQSTTSDDCWIDLSSKTFKFRSDENDNWVLPRFDDLRLQGNTIISGASDHIYSSGSFSTNPSINQNIKLKCSGTGEVEIDADSSSSVVKAAPEKSLVVKAGAGDNGGSLYLSPGIGNVSTGNVYINGIKWVTTNGSADQVLSSDGTGNLVWQTVTTNINDIEGVDTTGVQNGDVLEYSSSTSEWLPGSLKKPFEVVTATATLAINTKYCILTSTVSLPLLSSCTTGDFIQLTKRSNLSVTVNCSGTDTILLENSSTSSSLTYNEAVMIIFVHTGDNWSLLF